MSGPHFNITDRQAQALPTLRKQIFDENDFPAPSGGLINLEPSTIYQICDSFTLNTPLALPSTSRNELRGVFRGVTISYAGTGAMIRSASGSAALSGEMTITDLQVNGNNTNGFADLAGHRLVIYTSRFDDFASLGVLDNSQSLLVRFSVFQNMASGWKVKDAVFCNITQSRHGPNSSSMNSPWVTIVGNTRSSLFTFTQANFTRQAGETVVYVSKDNTNTGTAVSCIGAVGSGFFQKAGTGAITAFADGGTGVTTVTSNGHGLVGGMGTYITGTTSYNGSFIISNVTTNTFDIQTAFVADDATGTWDSDSLDETHPPYRVSDCAGQKDAKNIGSMFATDNTVETTIASSNTWTDINLGGIAASGGNIERWSLQNTTTGELRYDGVEDFTGVLTATITIQPNTGNELQFRVVKNGSSVGLDDIRISYEGAGGDNATLPMVCAVEATNGDLFRFQVNNINNASDPLIKSISVQIQ